MRPIKTMAVLLGLGLLALLAVVLVRTALLASKQVAVPPVAGIDVEADLAAQRLAGAVRLRTVSCQDPAQFDAKPFLELHQYLERTFPRVHAALQKEILCECSLLYCWRGSDPALKPVLLLAHQDVVPAAAEDEKDWVHPAFDGAIAEGYIWGRGTLDDKGSLMAILEAVEALLRDGFQPERTVYLAFGHDEEVGGPKGAQYIADTLHSRNVRLEYVLDEGSGIVRGVIPGVAEPVAVIALAEKGYVSFELSVESEGGHSSTPPRQTAIGILARALTRIEDHPFPADLTQIARFFSYVGPEMPFLERMVFANLWLTAPLVKRVFSADAVLNAGIRTTAAQTMIHGGVKENVLPSKATAVVNCRILPGETVASVTERIRKTVRDDRVQIAALNTPMDPSPISDVNARSYQVLQTTIQQTLTEPGTILAPFLELGASDSRRFVAVADNIYRFSPVHLDAEDLKRLHGVNERISRDDYARMIKFYAQIIRNSNDKVP